MREKISMIVFIIILGTVLTTILVAVDNYTAPLIAHNEDIKQKTSILKTFKIPYNKDDIEQTFLNNVTIQEEADLSYYISKDGAFAFLFAGSGLWGPIEGVISMNRDMKTVKGIVIIRQEETPGLGSRIAEREYLDRFGDKMFTPNLKMVSEGKSNESNEIDSITGATMSCKAFIAILNDQYKHFSAKLSGD